MKERLIKLVSMYQDLLRDICKKKEELDKLDREIQLFKIRLHREASMELDAEGKKKLYSNEAQRSGYVEQELAGNEICNSRGLLGFEISKLSTELECVGIEIKSIRSILYYDATHNIVVSKGEMPI